MGQVDSWSKWSKKRNLPPLLSFSALLVCILPHSQWVSLKHDGPMGRTTVGRNGVRRTKSPRTRVAGVWPVGQDDGPPDFILHVLSRGVINVHYCTYCTSEQTQEQPMATATRFSYYCVCLHVCVLIRPVATTDNTDRRPSLSPTSTSWCRRCRLCLVATPRRRRRQRVIVRLL